MRYNNTIAPKNDERCITKKLMAQFVFCNISIIHHPYNTIRNLLSVTQIKLFSKNFPRNYNNYDNSY